MTGRRAPQSDESMMRCTDETHAGLDEVRAIARRLKAERRGLEVREEQPGVRQPTHHQNLRPAAPESAAWRRWFQRPRARSG